MLDDPFGEDALLNVLSSLKDLPFEPFVARKKYTRKAKKVDRGAWFANMNASFVVLPPSDFVPMLHGDVRLEMAKRLTDAICSHNYASFESVMTQVCVSDVVYLSLFNGGRNPIGPKQRCIPGRSAVIDFFHCFMHSAPDLVPIIYEAPQGHFHPTTGESVVTFKVLASLTRTAKVVDVDTNSQGVASASYQVVPLPMGTPLIRTYHVGRYSLSLNAQHQIVKLCCLFKVVKYKLSKKSSAVGQLLNGPRGAPKPPLKKKKRHA